MATAKNINKNLSTTDLLDLICYNLAQFSYAKKRFSNVKNETDYNVFFDIVVDRVQQTAFKQIQEIKKLVQQKKIETDPKKQQEIDNQLNEFLKLPYNPGHVASYKNMARCVTKSLLLLGDFEIILADMHKEAREIDSVAQTNLLGANSQISKTYSTHYQEKHSLGPLIHSLSKGSLANQSRVEALLSLAKPQKPVRHQIWINDHLMIQSNLFTDKSLYDFLMQDPKKIGDLLYLTASAEEIEKKANGNLTQKFINSEIKQIRMEHLKREGEKYMEQYALITIELFGQLIKKLKKTSPATQNSALYDKLNFINGIKAPFSTQDILKMKEYLTIRDNLAHPTEFNLRPMGDGTHPDLLSQFEQDIVHYLSNLLNMNPQDITAKIKTFTEEETYDVRALISLMDTRKALRDICVKEGNLSPSTPNIFVSLGFIDTTENQTLIDALDLRNTLCHGKIDLCLAEQAEQYALKAWPVINKIASEVDKKFGVSLSDYYASSKNSTGLTLSDFQARFPFINTSFETDPDKKLFEKSVKKIYGKTDPLNKETLKKLHLFSLIAYEYINNKEQTTPCPYIENEFLPFAKEIDYLGKNPNAGPLPTLKQLVVKGILKAFEKGHPLPHLKSENEKN